jgi:hypothetical protein
MPANRSDRGFDPVEEVADVAEVVELVDVALEVLEVLEVADCCCNPISTPRIILERLALVLPVRPPSVAVVSVVLDVAEVELVAEVLDVVSSFVSRLARIWDSPDPLEPIPAMDMVVSPCDGRPRRAERHNVKSRPCAKTGTQSRRYPASSICPGHSFETNDAIPAALGNSCRDSIG